MKTLELKQMEGVEGGGQITQSMLVCGGLGLMFGVINPIVGAGVGLACSATWDDVEGNDPVWWSW